MSFKQNENEPNLKILSIESLGISFYPDRSRYALEVVKLLPQMQTHGLDFADFRIKSLDQVPEDTLIEALNIARYTVFADNHDAISVVARLALKTVSPS